jgi:hypothetical protein
MVSKFRSKVAGTAEAVCRKTGGKKSEIVDLESKIGEMAAYYNVLARQRLEPYSCSFDDFLIERRDVHDVEAVIQDPKEVKSGNMVATNLQNAAIELGMALQATVDLLDNKQVPQTALLNMPVIKKDKVDYYYSQLYVKPQDFLKTLPELIKKNMASGDYASQ